MKPSPDIRHYTIAHLETLLKDSRFWELDPLPITKQRILSQIRNPRASKDDLALLVAYENNRVVGYRGIFPDRIFVDDVQHKVGCFTTIWVEPEKRDTGIGQSPVNEALRAYDDKIYTSEFNLNVKRLYDASGRFASLKSMKWFNAGIRVSIR